MALNKEMELDNGVVVNYHRIVSLNKIVNKNNIIEVASYTSEEKRNEEKSYYESVETDKEMNVFINTTYFNKAYDENENIKNAYEYLKKLDKFKNSKDI